MLWMTKGIYCFSGGSEFYSQQALHGLLWPATSTQGITRLNPKAICVYTPHTDSHT